MRTILYPPTIDYSFMKQRPQHLMEKFAELGWGVYYCNKNQDINKPLTQTIKPNFKLVNNFSLLCEVLFEIGIFFTSWAKYVEIVDANTLQRVDTIEGQVLIAIAVYIGKTRLLDNFTT